MNLLPSLLIALLCVSWAESSVSVTISSAAPAGLQEQFLADATAQYAGILIKSPSANVWTFKISSKKVVPPVYPDNFLYGFLFGTEDERERNINIIDRYIAACSTETICTETLMPPRTEIDDQNYGNPGE